MLGRYIAVTLVILGGAMLVAPSTPDDEDTAQAAPPSPRPAAPPPKAIASAERPAQAKEAPADPAAASATTFATLAPADEAAPRPAAAPVPALASTPTTPAPLGSAGAPLPTLEDPTSLAAPSVTAATLALIADAEGNSDIDAAIGATAEAAGIGSDVETLFVTGTRVNVRSGPSTAYGVIGGVFYGDAVEILFDEGNGWAHVRLPDDSTGYMAMSFLAP